MTGEFAVERRAYGDHPSQFVDLYAPTDPPAGWRGTIISIHGGYWRATYGLDLNEPMARHLAGEGWLVSNIEYRRVTEETVTENSDGVWPEMSTDVLAAIDASPRTSGPTVLLGHSAGGHLALWAAAQLDGQIDGVVALAPVTDLFLADGLQLSNHATKALFGEAAADRPDTYLSASPLHLLPFGTKQLIVHGEADDAVPVDMSLEYGETAALLGDEVTVISDSDVDHFDVINPHHRVWHSIDGWLRQD